MKDAILLVRLTYVDKVLVVIVFPSESVVVTGTTTGIIPPPGEAAVGRRTSILPSKAANWLEYSEGIADASHEGALCARIASYKRDLASPVTEAAAAAELTADSRPGRTDDGMYCSMTWLAADVNCAPSVAWRFSG